MFAAGIANLLAWRFTEHGALHDSLTGLPNRALILSVVRRACQGRDRGLMAVLFIGLDNFKDANDGFGHENGDQLLRAIGGYVRWRARATSSAALAETSSA